MMRSFSVVLALLASMVLTAATVSKDEARQKALQFLSERGNRVAAARGMQQVSLQLKDGLVTDELYVFNVGQRDGFVIMSADDCTGDLVLGYADEGEIRTDNMPDNLRAWLQGYADQIRWMQQHGVKNDVAASRAANFSVSASRRQVSPRLSTLWNQSEPYNANCPKYAEEASGGDYYAKATATGCVATAAAQVMFYQAMKYELGSTTTLVPIDAYESTKCLLWNKAGNNITNTVEEKPVTTINWSAIAADGGSAPNTDEAKAAVALLMEYVGAGVQMSYGTAEMGGSTASSSSIPYMLKTYFGYDADVRFLERKDYTYSDWVDIIYKELTTNGPVLYGGQSTGGGHEFVLDGYLEEDYFYVNWGWGGLSNGYFKLSVLQSDKQGIGGSTSQDGYGFQQDAIVGVDPVSRNIDTSVRLTVSKAWAGATVYNRNSSEDNFLAVELYSAMMNKTGSVQSFDFGFGLYQNGECKQILWQESEENVDNSTGWGYYSVPSSFGKGLDDGVYQCVPVSRLRNSEIWYPDFSSEFYYIQATISGNTLTLEPSSIVNLSAASLVVSDNPTAGEPVTVTATIRNDGTLYSGDLLIGYISGYSDANYTKPIYTILAAQQIEMPAGNTSVYQFKFTPTIFGTLSLKLLDENKTEIGSTIVTINNGTAATNDLTVTGTAIKNGEMKGYPYVGSYEIYGNTIMATVTVRNNDSHDNTGGIRFAVYDVSTSSWVDDMAMTIPTVIPANSSVAIDYEISGFVADHYYQVYYCYPKGSNIRDTNNPYSCSNVLYTVPGVITYDAAGQINVIKLGSEIEISDNTVAAVDIIGCGTKTVIPNSNPNTIYIIGHDDSPSGLDGRNVVQNGVAAMLTLSDGYDFYSPVDFTATTATYTRQFTVGADGTNGWSTIVLPFTVSTVKNGGNVIDWFRSDEGEGHFWLKTFSSENGSSVNFDYTNSLQANTPYIIAVPGDTWGAKWDLTNKDITFEGSDVTVAATQKATLSGNSYKFPGSTASQAVTDCYVLDAQGSTFEQATANVPAFRAYFKPVEMLASQPELLPSRLFISDETTGIRAIGKEQFTEDNAVYNLNGQRMAAPKKGLYIVNGKKVIVK